MATQGSRSSNFPLDNLTYDIVTVLYEKSKALEAYSKYIQDAQSNTEVRQLLEQLRQQDEQAVQQLQQHLGRLIGQQGNASSAASNS